MSNFFDNFMGGLAFGMLASNPFFRGMGWGGIGCGCGWGGIGGFIFGGMYNAVNLCGFVNPFPSVFCGYGGGGMSSADGLIMPTTFANPGFPNVDFQTPCQTIWDMYTDPNTNYIDKMRDLFEKSNITQNSNTNSTNNPTNNPTNDSINDKKNDKSDKSNKSNATEKRDKKKIKRLNSGKTTSTSTRVTSSKVGDEKREFAEIYKSLGITDKRFQKIFEECVLSLNEGRKRGENYYKFDEFAMNKNGVLQPTYDDYRTKEKHLPKRDVKNMTMQEMCEIYYSMFYVKGGASDIKDDRLALYVFDSDVNMGVGTGKILLQRSGGDPDKFEEERRKEYRRRKGFAKNGNGWYARIDKTRAYADKNFSAIA